MAEIATIARPYAKALYDLAKEKDQLESWLHQLKILAEIVLQPKIVTLIDEPNIGYVQLTDTLVSLIDDQSVGVELKNFIYTLAEYKRLSVIPEIFKQYQDFVLSSSHTKIATIYTAYAIADAQFNQIIEELEQHFHVKLNASQVVDAKLIGGVKVEIGDQVLDLSVQARLNNLHMALMN